MNQPRQPPPEKLVFDELRRLSARIDALEVRATDRAERQRHLTVGVGVALAGLVVLGPSVLQYVFAALLFVIGVALSWMAMHTPRAHKQPTENDPAGLTILSPNQDDVSTDYRMPHRGGPR